jgi:DNA-directed RNA polymerase subunit RPC12/RpoP
MSSPDEIKDMEQFKYSQLYTEIEPVFQTLCNKVGIKNKIVLHISRDTKKFGHFTTYAVYGSSHEINISANYFQRGGKELLNTLLHECVHAINSENGIKDTSKKIHNKHFKSTSEKVGMFCSNRCTKLGYSNTKFTDESIEQWRPELDIITQILERLDIKEIKEKTKKAKKSDKRVYECIKCDTNIPIAFISKDVLELIRCKCGGNIIEV